MKVEKGTVMDVNIELQILANEEREERVDVEYEDLMNDIELIRQQEFLDYANESADNDANYYGVL